MIDFLFYSFVLIIWTGLILYIFNIGIINETIVKRITNNELTPTTFILNVKKSKSKTIWLGAKIFNDSINTSFARSIKKKYPIVDKIIVQRAINNYYRTIKKSLN